jgi:membrane dipeptidase
MKIRWPDLGSDRADLADGADVEISGWPATVLAIERAGYFLLAPEPTCCVGCIPSDPLACIEVFAASPISLQHGELRLRGTWRSLHDDDLGWRYQLRDARAIGAERLGLTRRSLLAAGSLVCLPIGAAAQDQPPVAPEELERRRTATLEALGAAATVDIHSHAGALLHVGTPDATPPFRPLSAPMQAGRMAVACLAIVSDSPTHRVTPEGRIRPFRDPDPGELYDYAQRGFKRLLALISDQKLATITSAAALVAARSTMPSAIVSAEGADFLEGRIERIDEAYAQWQLRHMQLTHYRVNELGDIQTEKPVYGGLTPFGAEVIGRCNSLGIVVDVAHGTYPLVKRAAEVTTKPLVLSHTSLVDAPRPRTRRISADHARIIASTGGVIGVWPVSAYFPDIAALADGISQLADIVGIDHVGLGTDMLGLVGPSILPNYKRLPDLADALLQRFTRTETQKILGGNYARVFAATLG